MVTGQYSPRAAYRFSLFRQSGARRVQPRWEDSEWELKEKFRELQSPDDPALDILALIELRQRAEAVFVNWHKDQFKSLPSDEDRRWFLEQVKALTTPATFFTWAGSETKAPLYHPLPVIQRKAVGSETKIIEKASQLSEFLIQLQQEQSRQGVLITTRSGGGKTVACRQADLLFLGMQQRAADEQKRQPSSATIPVWISLQHATGFKQEIASHMKGKSYQEQIDLDMMIKLLVANAHKELATTDDELLARQRAMHRQLHFGPSLVLFFDLNHANELDRELYTEAIIAFQKHPQLGKKHRCVVVYRGAGKGDRVIQRLLSNTDHHWPGFQEYDLKTIEDKQAIDYCGQIREFEQRLWKDSENGLTNQINEQFKKQKPDLVPCKLVLDGSEQQTRTLLQQLIRRSRMAKSYESDSKQAREEDNDSLISVPLLMHWVSLLDPQVLSRIANLTHLYREIVSQHLRREHPQMGLHQNLIDLKIYQTGEAKNRKPVTGKIVTGMTRIALAILAQGAGTTIEVDEACELLEDPSEYPEDDSRDWHLKSSNMPSLAKSDYNHQEFTPEEAQAILRHGLFRQEGDQLRFAHDSLIYYFAGMALREFKKPGKPGTSSILPETWAAAIADILLQNPDRWVLPAEFLGGAMLLPPENGRLKGQPSQALRELVMRLAAFWPDLPRDEAIAFMEPVPKLASRLCSTQPRDWVLQQVYKATNDHNRFAWKHPHLLLQEVMNRCRWFGAPGNEVEQWARQLDVPLEEGSSSRNTRRPGWLKKKLGLRLSDTLTIEGAHTGSIDRLTVYEGLDGPRIVSVGGDKRIVIIDPLTGAIEQTFNYAHTGSIKSLIVYEGPNGPRFVSVGQDNRIVIIIPETGEVERRLTVNHKGSVDSLTVYEGPDGPRIVSVRYDSKGFFIGDPKILISDLRTGTVERIIEVAHTGRINRVTVYAGPDGPRIISEGDDNRVVISDPRTGTVERTIKNIHTEIMHIAYIALNDARIFSKTSDQRIFNIDPWTGTFEQISWEYISALMVNYEGPEGPRIVTVDDDKRIVITIPETGEVERRLTVKHKGSINSLTVYEGPDGPRIVSVGNHSRIVISNPGTGIVERTIKGAHKGMVTTLSVYDTPKGLRIVSTGGDRRIVISDPRTGTIERTIKGAHKGRITLVTVYDTPKGLRIVSTGEDRRIVISDPLTGTVERTIKEAHRNLINCVEVYEGPEGPRIVTVVDDKRIVISNPRTGIIERTIEGAHTDQISSVGAYEGPDGLRIVSAGDDKRIVFIDPQTGIIERTIEGAHTNWIKSMLMCTGPDGLQIVSVSDDKRIVIIDPQTGIIERTINGAHASSIDRLTVYHGPDGPRIVSVGDDSRIVISDPRTGTVERTIEGVHTSWIRSMIMHAGPDGPRIVTAGSDNRIVINDPRTGTIKRTTEEAHTDKINSVTVYIGPEGPWIISAGNDRRIVISDLRTGTIERTIEGVHTYSIRSVIVFAGPDGPRIVSVGDDSRIVISDPQTGTVERILKGAHSGWINSVTVYGDPKDPRIVSAGNDKRIVISNPKIGTVERTIEGAHTGLIKSMIVYAGPEGPRIVSAGTDKRIVIINPRTGTIERTIEGAHTGWISSLAVYSGPDGLRIISVGRDQRIVIIDPQTGTIERTIKGVNTDWISNVHVYDWLDGPLIISVCNDGKTKLWSLESILASRKNSSSCAQPIITLFVQANYIAIDQASNSLICGVGKRLDVYEFMTN
ncbi:WD40 repeat domain-containing protein [Gimesia chilikensis]|uniref:WD domain, G-beta repeat n=1 Tax=Gimesia chilikensis TaxID=2605989 RepID=A0A517PSX8_9PLAN|nr:WD40 repeat domain-containing protein [Gimesia chilikensis]QDT22482.1 WD domain, G-beta repeat [Gimesia chilikensis]